MVKKIILKPKQNKKECFKEISGIVQDYLACYNQGLLGKGIDITAYDKNTEYRVKIEIYEDKNTPIPSKV